MNVLVIEDDEEKRRQLVTHLLAVFPGDTIGEERSLRSALESVKKRRWDLVLLDMSMPTFDVDADEDGGRPQVYGGRDILRQMRRLRIEIPVIVVTQFDVFGEGQDALTLDQLEVHLRKENPRSYKGAVYYSVVSEDWKDDLTSRVRQAKTELERR